MECKQVFIGERDRKGGFNEDRLPEFFDISVIKKNLRSKKQDHCELCTKDLGMFKKCHCLKCGATVCDQCSMESRRLSKMDKRLHKVCDKCDHEMNNSLFIERLE